MINKNEQLQILQGFFDNQEGFDVKYNFRLVDEYTELDEIKRHEEQTSLQQQTQTKQSVIYGIVQTLPSQLAPIQNLNSIQSTQLLTFFVPNESATESDPLGVEAKDIIQRLNDFALVMAGRSGLHGDTSYVIAPNLPVVGQQNNMLGYWAVDVSLSIGWQMMDDGVISNATSISVLKDDGSYEKLLWLDLAISRTRVPDAVNKASSQELETHIIQQGISMTLALPLQKSSFAWQFYLDALSGVVDKKYKIKVQIGEDTLLEKYFVATQINTHMSVGQVGSISIELSYTAQ